MLLLSRIEVIDTNLYARIRARREELGMSQGELAKRLGYKSRSTIAKIESGENDIPQSKIEAFADALSVTAAYLMGWEDDPLPSNLIPLPGTKRIPLLGTIACGNPITAIENPDEFVLMPDNVHADFALRCQGDSMINARILDGDVVYIQRQDEVDNGDIAAVIIGDEATLKRVYLDKENNRLTLMAENPAFPPLVFQGADLEQVRILGKAVAFLSRAV